MKFKRLKLADGRKRKKCAKASSDEARQNGNSSVSGGQKGSK